MQLSLSLSLPLYTGQRKREKDILDPHTYIYKEREIKRERGSESEKEGDVEWLLYVF
jgi:hypothetical protein